MYDGQVGCSAGSASALDLGLEVIRKKFGIEAANHIARLLLVSSHRQGGQSQFAENTIIESLSPFSKALEWANQNLQLSISINSLAKRANMSRSRFDRKFRYHFGTTPKRWLTEQRSIKAKKCW
ncbi:MAG: AraC family transcriptional activator FtrA [Arenicella sp.]